MALVGAQEVIGPASAADGSLTVFDGTTGKIIKDGGKRDTGARVTHSVAQSIANATETALAFDTERWDTDTIHDPVTNNSRLTAQAAGKYLVGGNVTWDAGTGDTIRAIAIRLNGLTTIAKEDLTSRAITMRETVHCIYSLVVNDYVELTALHNSGAAINVQKIDQHSPEFWIQRIG